MFFKDEEGVSVIQFGAGDIDVSSGLLDVLDKTIGLVALTPRAPSKIGTESERDECMLDTMFGVHTRLVFTDAKAIDVLIECLEKAKQCMAKDKAEITETMAERNQHAKIR